MTKEELVIEAEEWLNKWELCNKCNHKVECINEHSYCHLVVNRAYLAGAEPREKRIKDLEKENAELKEINEGYCKNRDRLISIGFPNFKDCKEYAEQLTKAKELLNEFLDFESSCMERGIYISDKIRTEAKQLISEVEK